MGITHIARLLAAPRAVAFTLGLASACFTADATVGAVCESNADCGAGQSCVNEVCGRCGDGVAQAGEVCFEEGDRVELAAEPAALRPFDVDGDAQIDLIALVPGADSVLVARGQGRSFETPQAVSLAAGPVAAVQRHAVFSPNTVVGEDAVVLLAWAGDDAFAVGPLPASGEVAATDERTGLGTVVSLEATSALGEAPAVLAVVAQDPGGARSLTLHTLDEAGVATDRGALALDPEARVLAVTNVLGDEGPEVIIATPTSLDVVADLDAPAVSVSVPVVVDNAVAVDFDGDGVRDLVGIDTEGGRIVPALHDGEGGFELAQAREVEGRPLTLVVGDLDRDFDRDLAVATEADGLALLVARGSAHPDVVTLPGPDALGDVLVTDLDRDGLAELIVSAGDRGEVTVLEVLP